MNFRAMPISIQFNEALPNGTGVPKEVQLMRVGRFFDQKGDPIEVTTQLFESMIHNFQNNVRGVELAIDYRHASDDIAAGWIKKIFTKDNGQTLWAEVDWTPKGEKVLKDKEFKYLSADFNRDFKHNETNEKFGPTLFGAGLTNRPFIKEMEPVILSETKGTQMDEKDKKIAELEAKIADLQKQLDADSAADAAGTEMADIKKQNDELKKQNEAYAADKVKADSAVKLAEQKGAFDKLLSEGKAVEAQRPFFMSGDTVKFAEHSAKVNLQGSGSTVEPPVKATNKAEAESEIIKLAEKHLSDKAVTSLSEGFQKVLRENSDLRKQYESN